MNPLCSNRLVRRTALALSFIGAGLAPLAHADAASTTGKDAFYSQLLKLPETSGYQPTRTFTIVVDTERGNQLVADDDVNLRFNLLWMEQFKPGYRAKHGGSAFGELVRSYLKVAYKSYREHNAQAMAALPDENGSIAARDNATDIMDSIDYNFRLTDDEIRLKIEYTY